MDATNRKEPRFIAHFDGFYRLKNNTEWLECYIYDISTSGASIRTSQILLRSDQIELCLDKEDKTNVIIAIVVNVSAHVVGVKFVSKNAESIIDEAVKTAMRKTKFT